MIRNNDMKIDISHMLAKTFLSAGCSSSLRDEQNSSSRSEESATNIFDSDFEPSLSRSKKMKICEPVN